MFEKLKKTSKSLMSNFEVIPKERKVLLDELAMYIRNKLNTSKEVQLIFICTHNSRRSHLAQVWAQAAANFYNVQGIKTYSGGTEETAFNTSAVNALKKAGFKINTLKEGKNPKYNVRFAKKAEPIICFSKEYNHKKNPKDGFVAIMTCSDADEACPVVEGAHYRTKIQYEDPKKFDGTEQEASKYEERSLQIGREMFYVFKNVSA